MRAYCGHFTKVTGALLLGGLLQAALVPSLNAAFLAPGSLTLPPVEPDPVGGTLIASLNAPFAAPGAFSGSLSSQVISGDAANPLGGLTFVYELANDAGSASALSRLEVLGFQGLLVDASYSLSGGVAPSFIDRNPSGGTVGFTFFGSQYVVPGVNSARLVLQTDAQAYGAASSFLMGSGIASAQVLSPLGPGSGQTPNSVPEPGTALAGVVALLGVAGALQKRRLA